MKLRKIITVLLATVTLTTVSGLLTSQPEMVQAKQTKLRLRKQKMALQLILIFLNHGVVSGIAILIRN